MKKTKILILTVKWGHYSIAKAVEDALKKGFNVVVEEIQVEKFSELSYTAIYKLFPGLWKIPFKLSEKEKVRKVASDYLTNAYLKSINEKVKSHRPDVIINVYFAFIPAIEYLSDNSEHLFINIVTNPRTFSSIEVSNKAYNLVFDKIAGKLCRSYGVPNRKILITGWFIRKEFQKTGNFTSLLKEHGLDKDILTFCIVGGSEGSYDITKILPAFLKPAKPLQVIFISGKNKPLLATVKAFSKIAESTNGSGAKIVPLGYTKDVHKYLHLSDLVIGKAGPNLLFETVATKAPFMAISHISGQEDGNLEVIKKYRLGYVEEHPVKAIGLIRKLIKQPKTLQKFDKSLEKLTSYNSEAGEKLKNLIEDKIN